MISNLGVTSSFVIDVLFMDDNFMKVKMNNRLFDENLEETLNRGDDNSNVTTWEIKKTGVPGYEEIQSFHLRKGFCQIDSIPNSEVEWVS